MSIHDELISGHRYCKKLTNADYGTVAFLISKSDILENKKSNANSFANPELRLNCIYFLIGYEPDSSGNMVEKIYVGQAGIRDNGQSVLDRLNEHAWLGNDPSKYIDKWTDIVVVTNEKGAWGATELDALEHIFWSLIPVGNRLNSQKPSCTGADLTRFTTAVNQIKDYLDYLEFTTFKEKTTEIITSDVKKIAESKSDRPIDLDHGTTTIPNYTTPKKTINEMLDLLPHEVWNDRTVFLDPACKDGGFLKAIHDRLVAMPELLQKYGSERKLSNHILSEQLYGIALNQNSKAETINTLDGFGYNIRVIPNYISILKDSNKGNKPNKGQESIRDILNKEFGKAMKIDVVIGNPPYQEDNSQNGRQTKPLYDKFIEAGINITGRLLVFITNNTFLTNDSKKELRDRMIASGLQYIRNYPISGEVFKGIGVSACIIIIDKNNTGHTFTYKRVENDKIVNTYSATLNEGDIITESAAEIIIAHRFASSNTMANMIIGDKAFGIASNGRIGFTGKGSFLKVSMLEIDGGVALKNKIEGIESVNYIYRHELPKGHEYLSKYKVICPHEITKTSLTALDKSEVLGPDYAHTENWALMGVFDRVEDAKNYTKYLKTKTVKFLCQLFSSTGMTKLTKVLFGHIPLQDFTSNSDIDWSQSIADIDKQLYEKYNLTQDEIDYIEQTISP